MQVIRFDAAGEVLSVQKNADGSVSATADVSRCGILEYRRTDGTTRRELVLPEHLFDPESLRTLGGVALTATPPQGHPPELLTPENAARYAVGHVHETVDAVDAPTEQDFGYVRVRLTGRTAEAVKKLTQGKLFTSPGYSLPNYDATPGVHPLWGPYDAIQGPRVYNHLAMTDTPRGGSGMVVHLDAADDFAEQIRMDPASWVQNEKKWIKSKELAEKAGRGNDYAYVTGIYKQMGGEIGSDSGAREDAMSAVVVRLDSIGRDVTVDPVAAEVIRQYVARRDAEVSESEVAAQTATQKLADLEQQIVAHKKAMDEAMSAMEKLKGEQVAMTASMDATKARADAAEKRLADPVELRKILAPRVALESVAREVLAKDQHARLDAMTDDEVRAATVATLLPSLKLDGVKGDRLVGMYETAVATRTRVDSKPPPGDGRAKPWIDARKTSVEIHAARSASEYVAPRRPGIAAK